MALTKVQKELVKPADSLNPTGAILRMKMMMLRLKALEVK